MYVTGFVNTVVKPPKPLPNFEVDVVDGLEVRFQNLASYHREGWWDFGDGSPLEPVTEEGQTIFHTYPRPGTFTAKMMLHNLLGEEVERAVPIALTAPPAGATPSAPVGAPRILDFKTTDINAFAPATIQLKGKVENAKLCVWSLDGKMRMTTDGKDEIDRMVTIERPGEHYITLAAFDGTQDEPKDERRLKVVVQPLPAGSVMAILNVTGSGTHHHTINQERTLYATFPSDKKENTVEFNVPALAKPGYALVEARVKTPDGKGPHLGGDKKEITLDAPTIKGGSARDLRLVLDEKNGTVRLTGKLTRSDAAAKGKEPVPCLAVPVVLTLQHRAQMNLPPQSITTPLAVPVRGKPSSAHLKLPLSEWTDVQRKLSLELKDGDNTLAQWPDLQQAAPKLITIQNHLCNAIVMPKKDGVEVMLQAN
jgi:hypothetical protein